jgi:hypothetical protein
MNAKALSLVFKSLSKEQQIKHIVAWAHAATIDARDTYIPGVEGIADPVRLRRFNELQHHLSGQLLNLVEGHSGVDHDLFLTMVFDAAKELQASSLKQKLNTIGSEASPSHRRRVG